MNSPKNVCCPEQAERFLQETLNDADQQSFIQHLDQCQRCQQYLESSSGEDVAWSDLPNFLQNDEFDSAYDLIQERNATAQAADGEIQNVLQLLGPTDDPTMLGRLAEYEISGVVGCGGMSVVLKGFDRSLDRIVAIKVLAPRLASSGAARTRFEREAKATAAVLHPNVIAIHGVSNSPPLPFLVMPYIKGESLAKRIKRQGPLPLQEVLRIGSQLAAGLAAAHAQGLVHRDIKPANILLESGVERVHVTDFGLARAADDASITRSGMIAGTPQFMSPEQARGDAVSASSDLFSLGSVLYAMSVGHPPFRAETAFGLLQKINQQTHRAVRESQPELPLWFERLINRLLSKNPTDRFVSATEVQQVLEQCLAHSQQPDRVDLPEILTAGKSRRWTFVPLSVTALGVLIVTVTFFPRVTPLENSSADRPASLIQSQHETVANALLQPLEINDQELQRIAFTIEQLENDISKTEDSLSNTNMQSAPQE